MTSATARALLAASPHVAQGLVAVFVVATGVLLVRARRLPTGLPAGAHERMLLGLVLTGALLTRVLWWRSGLTVPYWFSQTTPLYVAKALGQGSLWTQWTRLLRTYQVSWTHESATVMPVAVVFQLVFGPSFHLPVLVGAFYGVAAVLLAWALGRMVHSPSFGLIFASLVAVSPLQIVWSRHGGLYIASVTHVLLVMLVSYVAGKRRSTFLAVLAAVCVWATFFNYFAARAAIPLGLAALLVGIRHGRVSFLQAVRVLAAALATLGLIYLWARPPGIMAIVWPVYARYTGNRGEGGLADLITKTARPVVAELPVTLARYFLRERAGPEPLTWFHWEARSGGLCLAPVALLGLVGVAVALRRIGRAWLWLLVAGLGLAIPVLGRSSARRLLVLDLGWCALAALGLHALLQSRPARAAPRTAGTLAGGFLVALGLWSFATVALLNAALEERHWQRIPFGESGFFDGLACKRCLHAGYAWQAEIASNRFVVLFENDLEREDRTIPGGMPLYGELAALSAGRPRNFLEFYEVMTDSNREPPDVGAFYDSTRTDFASYLHGRLDEARPSAVIWHFERPTQWERWVIGRLERAGGTVSTFASPLSASPGAQVRTPWPLSHEVRALVDDMARTLRAGGRCPGLKQIATRRPGFVPLHLSAGGSTDAAGVPDWLVGSWFKVGFREWSFEAGLPAGSSVERLAGGGARLGLILGRVGQAVAFDVPSQAKLGPTPAFATRVGLDCAVRIGAHWWAVDPVTGDLLTTDPGGPRLPNGSWTGAGTDGHGRLVLASADQWLVVYDLEERVDVKRFSADVWPSLRVTTGECAPVLVGDGWYGTFNNLTSVLTVYDAEGTELGARDLNRFLGLGSNRITALGAQGQHVAVGTRDDDTVRTIEVKLGTPCSDG